jgi:imidazole glycerol phosphate synthase glutamine amidotransferase subunit
MISIFDYGAGNLQSVQNAFEHVGARFRIIRDARGIRDSERIVLPGVGNFGQMMNALDRLSVREVLKERLVAGVPFLGICLGLQALFDRSEEASDCPGLGIISGEVKRFSKEARVPHMGWNSVNLLSPSRLLPSSEAGDYFYFAHSYFAPVSPESVAVCDYESSFTAVIEHENLFAVQFHPEKSGEGGLDLLRRFIDLTSLA